ncbi:MAG TPA: GIY-YIG nuclease family protein [Opitutaceae bacterium]|nr:GIY-YIG nuclease family protein [Opitutaceae bacterium]
MDAITSARQRIFSAGWRKHSRGKVHSTRRFGQPLEVVCIKEMPSMDSARELERKLKAKKNPQVAIYLLSKGAD